MKKLSIIICVIIVMSGLTHSNSAVDLQKPDLSAVSAIVIDADTGKVIFAKNEHEIRAMASLTKVMTTILTIEAGEPDKRFSVDNYAVHVEGTTMGLRENDIVTRLALCYGMMLPSGNDASNVAAVNVSGSIPEFVKLMNAKAMRIGMYNTHFANPHGLDSAKHYSTAHDMAILTAYAMKNPTFREICSLQTVRTEFGNPPYKRWLRNNNKMLLNYQGCIGVKTGFTDNARRCLITAAERDGVTLIAVTLNAPDDWNDHTKMLNYGFAIHNIQIHN